MKETLKLLGIGSALLTILMTISSPVSANTNQLDNINFQVGMPVNSEDEVEIVDNEDMVIPVLWHVFAHIAGHMYDAYHHQPKAPRPQPKPVPAPSEWELVQEHMHKLMAIGPIGNPSQDD